MEGSISAFTSSADMSLKDGTSTSAGITNGFSNHMPNHVNSDVHISKDKHHSSSSKDKHHSSSKDKHHSSSSSKSHHHSSSKDKHSSSSSSKDKHHSSSKDKHHSSSSSSKDKHHSSSHSSSKDKHHSSSSGHKDGSSSSSSKHHSSSSSKHKDGSKDKHSSSSHKNHSSSSSKEHSSGDKHKHSSSSSSSKHKDGTGDHKSKHDKPKKEGKPIDLPSPLQFKLEVESPVKYHPEPPLSPFKLKIEKLAEESDDDIPLSARAEEVEKKVKKRPVEESDDDEPLTARIDKVKKVKSEEAVTKKKRKAERDIDEPVKKKKKKMIKTDDNTASPTKKSKAKKEETEEKWRWWEEERKDDGTKWKFLEHKGPVFAAAYEPLPSHVNFYYNGKKMKLSIEAEEVATFYGKMIDHNYTTMETFNKNFFKDWRKTMTREEREIITDLSKCNFKEIDLHFKELSEKRKAMSKEEKNKIKEQNAAIVEEYGYCIMDNHREKIGNFRIEPPGLFRGRGSHPKMGMLKRRTLPSDVIINCSKDSVIPKPPDGHKWKEVRHDNKVSWLCCWIENVQGQTKYVMLNPASKLKGEKDWMKYETARQLHKTVDKIRAQYRDDLKSKEMRIRQRAVAMYFIDKLALRAGNEKDEDTADTVGCCSLRVEHINLYEQMDDKEYVVEFDFLGKDSIRYYNKVPVDKRVFKNLVLFKQNKNDGDDLFDRLNTAILNKHLNSLMEGLTAKVFRTYNASKTLQEQLDLLTNPDDPVAAKFLSYNRANRAVAVLCNHQRAVPKNFSKQMENLQARIDAKKDAIKQAKKDLKNAKSEYKATQTDKSRVMVDRKKKAIARLEDQLTKLEVQATDKDENKEIALGTSKLNYLDPRISVAWCKKWDVPLEKIYNKTQREKFAWAIDMADEDYRF